MTPNHAELGRRFLAARPDRVQVATEAVPAPAAPPADPAAVGLAIAGVVDRARARFPAIGCGATELVDHFARTMELAPGDLAAAIADQGEEIVLAAACLAGDRGALATLDRDYGVHLRALVAQLAGDRAGDIVQEVWARLLVARSGAPGRLADYGGRGSLLTWLRVVAAREAVSALRKRRDVAVDDEILVGRLVASQDPALALIRAQSAAAVKRAFEAAVTALAVRERNLLRQHILDGLTIDDLGALYGVHRVTAARWLTAAREAVWARTQRQLRDALALSPTDVASLLAEVRDWIDFSLERVL